MTGSQPFRWNVAPTPDARTVSAMIQAAPGLGRSGDLPRERTRAKPALLNGARCRDLRGAIPQDQPRANSDLSRGSSISGRRSVSRRAKIRIGPTAAILLTLAICLTGAVKAKADSLIEAARFQDAEAVRMLLDGGTDPNQRQADGATALHWAVYRQDSEMADLLLAAGADVNAVNRLGASALFVAAEGGRAGLIQQLLEAGADPDIALPMGETPLMSAARVGSAEGVRLLLAAGANVDTVERSRGQSALMWVAAQGHMDVARELIAAGADLEARSKVRPRLMFAEASNGGAFDQGIVENLGGYSPLLFAARNGHGGVTRLLIEAGAEVDGGAGNGASPLVVAAHSGHFALARRLLEFGADPNAMGAGYNALHAAVLRGDLAMVNALLEHGADPNVRLERPTPVQRASEDWALRAPLVSATPYWLAASFREAEIMRALARAGADPLLTTLERYRPLRDRESRLNPPPPEVVGGFASALQAAVRGASDRNRYYVIATEDPVGEERLALDAVIAAAEHGVDLDHADFTGATALHDAAARNLTSIVRELAERGANVNARNGRGQTPLDIAEAPARRSVLNLESNAPVPAESVGEILREYGGVLSRDLLD